MKQSWKDFLLTLVISIVIFAAVAFFLIRSTEGLMGDLVSGVRAAGSNGKSVEAISDAVDFFDEGGEDFENNNAVSMLFIVMDDNNRADVIVLLGVETVKKSATMALIPGNTGVTEAGVTYRLSDLDAEYQIGTIKRFIREQTGIKPDYYMAITRDGFSNWVDFMGGVTFTVPREMEDFDPVGNRRISLPAGEQKLSGDQVAQFLAFSDYGEDMARDDALLRFVKAFSTAFLRSANLSEARSRYYNVARHMITDFEEKDLTGKGAILFRFGDYGPNIRRIPGATDADGFYTISTERVTPMFEVFQ